MTLPYCSKNSFSLLRDSMVRSSSRKDSLVKRASSPSILMSEELPDSPRLSSKWVRSGEGLGYDPYLDNTYWVASISCTFFCGSGASDWKLVVGLRHQSTSVEVTWISWQAPECWEYVLSQPAADKLLFHENECECLGSTWVWVFTSSILCNLPFS